MEPVLVSALEHWSYCPRQCGLIHLESAWDENVFTLRGRRAHERADTAVTRTERGRRVERALPIWSDELGLQGRADVVEFLPDGTPLPVEYKSGPRRSHGHAEIQLCAQALCLEEMFGRPVPEGAIYFADSHARAAVAFDEPLRQRTHRTILAVRAMLETESLPAAKHDARCRQCSLLDACLPQTFSAGLGDRLYRPLPEPPAP